MGHNVYMSGEVRGVQEIADPLLHYVPKMVRVGHCNVMHHATVLRAGYRL